MDGEHHFPPLSSSPWARAAAPPDRVGAGLAPRARPPQQPPLSPLPLVCGPQPPPLSPLRSGPRGGQGLVPPLGTPP
jgi:hypothetical protein